MFICCMYVALNLMHFQFHLVQFDRSHENGSYLPNGRTSVIEAMYLCSFILHHFTYPIMKNQLPDYIKQVFNNHFSSL